jgi:hypothetical protein
MEIPVVILPENIFEVRLPGLLEGTMKLLTYVLSAAVLTALFATSSFAQSERGSISGTVTDSSLPRCRVDCWCRCG